MALCATAEILAKPIELRESMRKNDLLFNLRISIIVDYPYNNSVVIVIFVMPLKKIVSITIQPSATPTRCRKKIAIQKTDLILFLYHRPNSHSTSSHDWKLKLLRIANDPEFHWNGRNSIPGG